MDFTFNKKKAFSGCGGVFTGSEAQIQSPNYPDNYLPHMYCIYYLSAPPDKALRLTFDAFDIENVANRDDCKFDSVQVYKWFTSEESHGELLGR